MEGTQQHVHSFNTQHSQHMCQDNTLLDSTCVSSVVRMYTQIGWSKNTSIGDSGGGLRIRIDGLTLNKYQLKAAFFYC